MNTKRWLALVLLVCVAFAAAPFPARGQDALRALGVWDAFEEQAPYQNKAYDTFFYDEARGIVLVILYGQQPWDQVLCRFDKLDGRWRNTDVVHLAGPVGEVGTLRVMNSEEPGMPELAHSAFDTSGKGFFESFWFEYHDGTYRFKVANLVVPLPGLPLREQGVLLGRTAQGISAQRYTYVRDSAEGRKPFGEAALHTTGDILLRDGILVYPREEFLPMLAEQGILFGAPKDLPQDAAAILFSSPWSGWRLTGWAQPGGGDTGFMAVRHGERNVLICLKQKDGAWTLQWVNEHALPHGALTMSLSDATGTMMLVPQRDAAGRERTHYGRALAIAGDDGNGEYPVRQSIWEMDDAGRYLLRFYAHEGQSGMMSFEAGSRTYLELPQGDLRMEDATPRDLEYFTMAHLPEPYPPAIPGGRAIALVNNPDPKDRLNLRKAPWTDADMIGRYYNGTPVSILEDSGGDWVKVWIGWDRQGYMMRKFLAFGQDIRGVQPAMPTYAMDKAWNLYYEPFPASHVKASYQGGQVIQVMGLMAGWWHVRLLDEPETIGFIPEIEPL